MSIVCRNENVGFELIIPKRDLLDIGTIFGYYNGNEIEKFKVTEFSTIDLDEGSWIKFWASRIQFLFRVLFYLLLNYSTKSTIIYTRDAFLGIFLGFFYGNIFYEAHGVNKDFFSKMIFEKAKGVVSITRGIIEEVKVDYLNQKFLLAPDGVSSIFFNTLESKNVLRKEFGLSPEIKYITYIGSFGYYDWKGLDVLLESQKLIDYKNVIYLIVGGHGKVIDQYRSKYGNENIVFVGGKKSNEIPKWQKVSDVLVIPNKKGNIVSERYTSPLKLFEYMASGVPIVASDLPSLREVLNDDNATFFEPNDPKDLAEKLKSLFDSHESYEKAKLKSVQAYKDVQEYTYAKRAHKIFDFVIKLSN